MERFYEIDPKILRYKKKYKFFQRSVPRVNLDHLRSFEVLAALQHYGKAAEPIIAMETEEDAVIAGLVAAGFGIAVLPDDPLFQSLPLAVLPLTDPDPARTAYLSRRRGTPLPNAAEQFWAFCQEKLA